MVYHQTHGNARKTGQSLSKLATIAAIATPPGRGGIGILRVSGSLASAIAVAILGQLPPPRLATYTSFLAADGSPIDQGLALFFPNPHSFTGEDVLELQGHGGPVLLDMLLERVLQLGAVLASPGEFSERAFLNNKLDLAQAEAIADLIAAESRQAARSALRSLQGEFSKHIEQLLEDLIALRIYVEAAIDFPEEEVDFLADTQLQIQLRELLEKVEEIEATAKQGAILQEGMNVVIAGEPNAGKSSLLNCLSGEDTAIVTHIPGTTRDVLRQQIHIDGMPLHIIDTAGLRETEDTIEKEGIRRAQQEIKKADCILLVFDSNETTLPEIPAIFPKETKLIFIANKVDLHSANKPSQEITAQGHCLIKLSAKNGQGINLLREHLKSLLGYKGDATPAFSARRRHLNAIAQAKQQLHQAEKLLQSRAGELLAEELKQAQNSISEITGKFLPDELLGRIFAGFCIGK